MKLKNMVLILFFLLSVFFLQAANLNISRISLIDFTKMIEENKSVNYNITYMWSGTIKSINNQNGVLTIEIVKGEWITKNELVSYKVLLKSSDRQISREIEEIGLYKKIIFIGQVTGLDRNRIPIFVPVLVKKA